MIKFLRKLFNLEHKKVESPQMRVLELQRLGRKYLKDNK